jgi:hypothetical protein
MPGYRLLLLAALLALLSGCGRNMYDQAKFGTYDASPFYTDGASARPLLENTVSRSRGEVDAGYYTGQSPDGIAAELPFELTEAVLERGQERYNIYCAPCHNYSGNGQGMIVQKGFVQPTSFSDPRLLASPVGYFFGAATNGFGRMFSYASRIPVEDRWAIAAYIKALQYSQSAPISALPADLKEQVVSATQTEAQEAAELARTSAEAARSAAQTARDAAQAVEDAINQTPEGANE